MVVPYAFLHLQIVNGDLKFRADCKATHSEGNYDRLGFMITPETEITITKEKKDYRSQPYTTYSIYFRDKKAGESMSVTVTYLSGYGSGRGSVRQCSGWERKRLFMNTDKCIAVFDKDSIELNFYQTPWPHPTTIKRREENDAFNKYLKNDKEILKTLKYLRLDANRI